MYREGMNVRTCLSAIVATLALTAGALAADGWLPSSGQGAPGARKAAVNTSPELVLNQVGAGVVQVSLEVGGVTADIRSNGSGLCLFGWP